MAFIKTILRMFKSNIGRFIAITAIMTVAVALITGIGEVGTALEKGGDLYLSGSNVPDIIVKSTSDFGFTPGQIEKLESLDITDGSLAFSAYDTEIGETMTRMYFLPLPEMPVNEIELTEGRLPGSATEILAERGTPDLTGYSVGDTVGGAYTVTGITVNPLMFSKEAEPSTTEDVNLGAVIYFDSAYAAFPVKTDMYITVSGARAHNIFSNKYKDFVADAAAEIKALDFADSVVVLTLEENLSYAMYKANIEKVRVISFIIPIFFAAVVALVILTTMTRLVEKERQVVGCYKTLGVSGGKIRAKYLLFILICFILGCALGLILGSLVIMPVVYSAYAALFVLPALAGGAYLTFGLITSGIIIVLVAAMTLYVIAKQVKEKPAELLKAKAPKPGKKILLEKIPLIWNRLKFKYKSTMRNIFRNAKNFVMTVISVAGSTALVFAGFGLHDAASDPSIVSDTAGGIADSISLISIIIIICAAALSILVMYNLTNMIIEERRREIATLKVLGYKNIELAGYVFREVFIMALIGIIVGLPVGMLLVGVVFEYVGLGSLAAVQWYSYIVTFALAVAFVAIVFLMLYRKIAKTDMNASLKSIE